MDAILAEKSRNNKDVNTYDRTWSLGFCAGADVDVVIEGQSDGHNLGRIIRQEMHIEHQVPGIIGSYSAERVIHAPATGE